MGEEETAQEDHQCQWGLGWMDDGREMGVRNKGSIDPANHLQEEMAPGVHRGEGKTR